MEENDSSVLQQSVPDQDGTKRARVGYFQDAKGRISLSPVEPAQVETTGHSKSLENVVSKRRGFISLRKVAPSSGGIRERYRDSGVPVIPVPKRAGNHCLSPNAPEPRAPHGIQRGLGIVATT